MPFSVTRVGQYVGARADRIAIARYSSDSPELITLIWNGNSVKHTLWYLLPNGDLYPTELHSQAGGPELSIAQFSDSRLVSIHRSGSPGTLKFEAWQTGGTFQLSDDAQGPGDRNPELVTFGGEPGILSVPPGVLTQAATTDAIRMPVTRAAATSPGTSTGTTSPPAQTAPKIPVAAGNISVSLKPKAGHAILASITQGNHLRVSLWGFDNGGDYKVLVGKYTEIDGGSATGVSIVKIKELWAEGPVLKGAEAITATRADGYALKLQRWRITLGSQGVPASIQLLGEHTAPEKITEVAAAPVALNGTQVATAVRLENGTLKVIGWKMESGGGITRWVEATGGAVTTVSAAQVRGRNIVTAVREGDGRFKASYWQFPSDGSGSLTHRGDAVEGKAGLVRCAHLAGTGTNLGETVAATQTEDGKLQLFRYRVMDS